MKNKELHIIVCLVFLTTISLFSQTQIVSSQSDTSAWAIAWSPSGELLAEGSIDGVIRVQNRNSSVLHELKGAEGRILTLEWSADSTRLAGSGDDKIIRIWNISDPDYSSGELIASFVGHEDRILSLAWSHDQSILVSVSREERYTFRVWNLADLSPEPLMEYTVSNLLDAQWSPDGNILALASEVGVFLFGRDIEFDNANLADYLYGEFTYATAIDWSIEGNIIAVGKLTGEVYFLNTETKEIEESFMAHTDVVTDITWSPNNKQLLTASLDGTLKRWDVKSQSLLDIVSINEDSRVLQVDWHPNGYEFAYSNLEKSVAFETMITLDDVRTRTEICLTDVSQLQILLDLLEDDDLQGFKDTLNEQAGLNAECQTDLQAMIEALQKVE